MAKTMRCSRCGASNDVGICWSYSHDYPEPSGHEHQMVEWIQEAPTMTLEEVIEMAAQPYDELWESHEDDV